MVLAWRAQAWNSCAKYSTIPSPKAGVLHDKQRLDYFSKSPTGILNTQDHKLKSKCLSHWTMPSIHKVKEVRFT